jgi:hypothetical protein
VLARIAKKGFQFCTYSSFIALLSLGRTASVCDSPQCYHTSALLRGIIIHYFAFVNFWYSARLPVLIPWIFQRHMMLTINRHQVCLLWSFSFVAIERTTLISTNYSTKKRAQKNNCCLFIGGTCCVTTDQSSLVPRSGSWLLPKQRDLLSVVHAYRIVSFPTTQTICNTLLCSGI